MKIEDLEMAKKGIEFGLAYLDEQSDISDYEKFKSGLLSRIAENGWKNGQVLWPLRVALSGEEFSPGAFELVHILGLDVSRERIRAMLEKLGN
jgi:glutamyl/glutaminyl-tRNA synthetase